MYVSPGRQGVALLVVELPCQDHDEINQDPDSEHSADGHDLQYCRADIDEVLVAFASMRPD